MARILDGEQTYLGDGLYASFDGYQVVLRAPNGSGRDMEVFLDPDVHHQFLKFSKDLAEEIQTARAPRIITSENANDASEDDQPF